MDVRGRTLQPPGMRIPYPLLAAALLVLPCCPGLAAESGLPAPEHNSDLLTKRWSAQWITHPDAPRNDYAAILARKVLDLPSKPERFVIHVSGDARYRLKVNGHSVCTGPQWGAAPSWRYESVDLAPWLVVGKNVITARVRSYGDGGPMANMGRRLGFILQGDSAAERIADTNDTWKLWNDVASQTYKDERDQLHAYFALGPGESLDASAYPWGWEEISFDDQKWSAPKLTGFGFSPAIGAEPIGSLSPRSTPLMEETKLPPPAVRRAEGVTVRPAVAGGSAPYTIPARTKATVLYDQGHLTNAYPQLLVSGGRGARVGLAYAEALIDKDRHKAHRDEIEGRQLVGMGDEFRPDGGDHRLFATDDFRTFRYLELRIETGDQPLVVEDLHGIFTGYPFKERGSFASDDARLKKIWDVGWRTARLCAVETYFDCPYYEQLQYIGDTRIQALISLYVAGDDRPVRNAIELFDRSRLPEGITQSRYPSASPQLIPTFSLFWVDMVHDYWRHRTDDAFVFERLAGIRAALDWFEQRVDSRTGLLGPLVYWPFVDWVPDEEWVPDPKLALGGVPPGGREGGSSVITLQFAYTLQHAAELFDAYEHHEEAARYSQLAGKLKSAVNAKCWDETRKLYADTPEKKTFSQHASTFAVLSGAIQGADAKELMRRVNADTTIAQATIYFRFYVLRAMKQAGLGDEYLKSLAPWHEMLALGLSTFAEKNEPTRSDCHAWSASPLYEFLATVCGVEPASAGFGTVRIEPHLGELKHVEGRVPHPVGDLTVKIDRTSRGATAEIQLPAGVTGEFVWQGKITPLREGAQTIQVQ